jgi:hypothetical protein
MPGYAPSDDGKVVDGRIVVFLEPEAEDAPAGPGAAPSLSPSERAELAGLQAKALTAAAEKGVPFCAECEQARRDLAKRQGGPR